MHKSRARVLFLISIVLFSGCAGNRFARLSEPQVTLNASASKDIVSMLGKPTQEGTVIQYGKRFNVLSYSFARSSFSTFAGRPIASRTQMFYFHDDRLVGHVYTSTTRDSTKFKEENIEKIKEGETKIEEAVALLGPPSGEYVYPFMEKEGERAKVYYYFAASTRLVKTKIYNQLLKISYNEAGLVTKVEYLETGDN